MFIQYNTVSKEVIEGDMFNLLSDCYEVESPIVWINTNSDEYVEWDVKRTAENERRAKEEKLAALKAQYPDLFEFQAEKDAKVNEILDALILEALNV